MISYQQRRKAEVHKQLGDKCQQCGEKDPRVLQIDHVNSDGAKERKLGRLELYKKVEDTPHRYQLLCANCNWRKRSWEFNRLGAIAKFRMSALRAAVLAGSFGLIFVLWKLDQ